MNLSRINKIQGLTGRDYEIEFLRLLTGKDLQDILLTFEDLTSPDGSILYESILLANFQAKANSGNLTAGKKYAITDVTSSIGECIVLLDAYNGGAVANGLLIYPSYPTDKVGVWDIQFDVPNGVILSYYNRAYDVRCTSDEVLLAIFTYLSQGLYTKCDFSNYTGTLTFDNSGFTRLQGCDFSNSSADFDTSDLDVNATFSGRILNNFTVPFQNDYPCDFTNTIVINADGTNNMEARIVLSAAQSTLDYTGFESAGVIVITPDAGGNTIDTISNAAVDREYKITSNDVSSLLIIGTGVNIVFSDIVNSIWSGLIQWNTLNSDHNEIYFKYNGAENLILSKTNTYP